MKRSGTLHHFLPFCLFFTVTELKKFASEPSLAFATANKRHRGIVHNLLLMISLDCPNHPFLVQEQIGPGPRRANGCMHVSKGANRCPSRTYYDHCLRVFPVEFYLPAGSQMAKQQSCPFSWHSAAIGRLQYYLHYVRRR